MANQFTKAEEEGKEKPQGTNQFIKGTRTGHDEATKDRMRAAKAAELLEQELDGSVELKDGRRAAAKILMEYGKPKLAAVEQTVVNEYDRMSEDDLRSLVKALITSNPWLIAEIQVGLRAVDAPDGVVNEQQTQRSMA
jgi:hypothetical protein